MLDITTIVIFLVMFCLLFAYIKARKPSGLPPGPATSLFSGNCSLVVNNKSLHKTFAELKRKYGPLYSLQLGWYPAVVLSSHELLKEALVNNADQFSDRAVHMFLLKLAQTGNKGIVLNNGESFKACRRLAMTAMRDFGVGKQAIEEKVMDEARAILNTLEAREKQSFQFGNLFAFATCNVICSILFGLRHEYNDPDYDALITSLNKVFQHNDFMYENFLPPYALTVIINPRSFKLMEHWNKLTDFVSSQIKQHRQTFDATNIRDFVDIYLKAEQDAGNSSTGKEDDMGLNFWSTLSRNNKSDSMEANVAAIITDFFSAGTETTSTTLLWAIAYIITHPEVQEKCRETIHQVVGKDKAITMKDKQALPYVEATLCEVQRISNTVPQAVFHCTKGPVKLQQYEIPDKTIVIPDLYSIHMDPDTWKQPDRFDPLRFLDNAGQLVKPAGFMPFGIGRRACLGEGLAKTELFLIFASMLQHYRFTSPDVSQVPGIHDAVLGFTLAPPPYQVIATAVE